MFLQVMFWMLLVIVSLGGFILVVLCWLDLGFAEHIESALDARWAKLRDPSDASQVMPFWAKWSSPIGILASVGVSVLWMVAVAFMFQWASWIYDWGL